MVSVIIPAHNEERVLGRLLEALDLGRDPALEVVVAANGCTDRTGEIARRYPVTLLDLPEPGKAAALERGDAAASSYPRLYVDADVELTRDSLAELCGALVGSVHATGPRRVFPMSGVSWPVRVYYEFWQRLPTVGAGLFGRGVIAVDEEGHRRLVPWTSAMSDDLRTHLAFGPTQRSIVETAPVVIWPPKTYRDLLARRVRAMTGNALLGHEQGQSGSRTGVGEVLTVLRSDPSQAPGAVVFAATAIIAKILGARRARRGDQRWLRDESSRA